MQFKLTHKQQEIEYTCFIPLNFQVQSLHTQTHIKKHW